MSGRPGFHSARTNKGHPRRQARRDGAAERLALHVHHEGCKRYRLIVQAATFDVDRDGAAAEAALR